MVAEGYQKGFQEGYQKGLQEALSLLQETCIRYVQKCFPTLANYAKQQVNSVTDINHLHMAFDAMVDATVAAEVEHILKYLSDEVQSTQ
jgi:flagellar biosynthesis/type III secretory pathway protein FliH